MRGTEGRACRGQGEKPRSHGGLASRSGPGRTPASSAGVQALTDVVHGDGHRLPTHGEEGQGVLVPLPVDERVPREVNGQNVVLGTHAAEVPLHGVIEAETQCGYALGHVAIDSWKGKVCSNARSGPREGTDLVRPEINVPKLIWSLKAAIIWDRLYPV